MPTLENALQQLNRLKRNNSDLRRCISDLLMNQDKYTADRIRALESENKRLKQAIIRLVTEDGTEQFSKRGC